MNSWLRTLFLCPLEGTQGPRLIPYSTVNACPSRTAVLWIHFVGVHLAIFWNAQVPQAQVFRANVQVNSCKCTQMPKRLKGF